MNAPALGDIETHEAAGGTRRPAEQLGMSGEDAVDNGFITHHGLYVAGIDGSTDDHLYPVGIFFPATSVCLSRGGFAYGSGMGVSVRLAVSPLGVISVLAARGSAVECEEGDPGRSCVVAQCGGDEGRDSRAAP
ncbi:hypothetical protein SGLAU_00220 [Streptomyces glaucescens]|uniref:Uncharacterized protein n=1 Tax=Streptomyces glaucescens TaxID=1907 RepID=A0A089WXC0_STRGA|nr:hypothetical protein SGLAU_00220 [Streptomyces glaucescens]